MSQTPSLLLTGGSGFVGRYLTPRVRAAYPDHRLVMLSRSPGTPAPAGWICEQADMTDVAEVQAVVERIRPSVVLHLAAQSSVGQATRTAESTWRLNVIGTFALTSAVARLPELRLFFYASTAEVYGASFSSGPATEQTPTAPMNSYAVSKLAAERLIADLLPQAARLIITRAFNHSGPGQDERFVLPSIAGQIARRELLPGGGPISVGNLNVERDILHVEDVVEAYMLLLSQAEALPRRTIVNIASGTASPLTDIVDRLRARARAPISIVIDPERVRPTDVPCAIGDASLLRKLTGWEAQRGMDDLLDDVLGWARRGIPNEPQPIEGAG